MAGFHEGALPCRDCARRARRARTAHGDRDTFQRAGGAQCTLGPLATEIRCGLRCALDRGAFGDHRILRGAARAASWLPLPRPVGLDIRAEKCAPDAKRPASGGRGWCAGRFPAHEALWRCPCALRAADREALVEGSVRVAVNGTERIAGTHFDCDTTTGLVTFPAWAHPAVVQASPQVSCSMCRCASTRISLRWISRLRGGSHPQHSAD